MYKILNIIQLKNMLELLNLVDGKIYYYKAPNNISVIYEYEILQIINL